MVDTSIVSDIINGEAISQFVQDNLFWILIAIVIGWVAVTLWHNKELVEATFK